MENFLKNTAVPAAITAVEEDWVESKPVQFGLWYKLGAIWMPVIVFETIQKYIASYVLASSKWIDKGK